MPDGVTNTKDSLHPGEMVEVSKKIRTTLDEMRSLLESLDPYPLSSRVQRHQENAIFSADQARFYLGYAIGEVHTMNPYEKVDNVFEARGDTIGAAEERDSSTFEKGEMTTEESLLRIRQGAEDIYETIQDLHRKMVINQDMLYQYLEQAVMSVRELRSSCGVVYSEINPADE